MSVPATDVDAEAMDEVEAWAPLAACRDVDTGVFFDDGRVVEAILVCQACPVQARCREAAFADPATEGVWGGWTTELRALAREGPWPVLVGPLLELLGSPHRWAQLAHGPLGKVEEAIDELCGVRRQLPRARFELVVAAAEDGTAQILARYVPGQAAGVVVRRT